MVGNSALDCAEYTMCKFTSESAAEFVALELLLNWNKEQASPLLRPELNKVGISLMAHKKQENLFQLLFVCEEQAPILNMPPAQQPQQQREVKTVIVAPGLYPTI